MKIKVLSRTLFLLICLILSSAIAFAEMAQPVTFDSGEHIYIGNLVKLFDPIKHQYVDGGQIDLRQWGFMTSLQTPLTFGRIVAVPDLFADVDAISDGQTHAERRLLFNKSFNVFLTANPKAIDKVFDIMQQEVDLIKNALDKGIPPSQAYAQKGYAFDEKYVLVYPHSAKLLLTGWDHFGQYAHLAYQAGHAEAIAVAWAAHNESNIQEKQLLLATAYAKEAYTCHFLSDSFAAGHMRTPYKKMITTISQHAAPQALASILGILMHDEDNKFGLEVTNSRGNAWTAYGDTHYLDPENAQNKKYIDEAMQASVDEVTQAYLNGSITQPNQYAALAFFPKLDSLQDFKHYVNSSSKTIPMFYFDSESNSILRRKNLNALHPTSLPLPDDIMLSHGELKGWWEWVTLLELEIEHHPKLVAQLPSHLDLSKITDAHGQLTNDYLYSLAHLLSPVEKTIFCVDPSTDKVFRNYLQCN